MASTANHTLGALISVTAWIKPTTFGENQSGAIWQQGGTADLPRYGLRLVDNKFALGPSGWGFVAERITTESRFNSATNTITLNVWTWLGVTYDATLTANTASLYLNGQPVALGAGTLAGAGAQVTDSQGLYLGNNGTTVRTFAGLIGEVGVWARLLSAAEMAAVYTLGVLAVPDAYQYVPLDTANARDYSGNASTYTVTGALLGENPPTRPAMRRG